MVQDFKVIDIAELSIKYGDKFTVLTKEEWLKRGTQLFGPDTDKWRFVCPACGHVAAVEDFRKYKEQGAKPDSATCNCIGRFDGHMAVDMGTKPGPCNYTGYGLFDFCPMRVIDNGKEIRCFAFEERRKT